MDISRESKTNKDAPLVHFTQGKKAETADVHTSILAEFDFR